MDSTGSGREDTRRSSIRVSDEKVMFMMNSYVGDSSYIYFFNTLFCTYLYILC